MTDAADLEQSFCFCSRVAVALAWLCPLYLYKPGNNEFNIETYALHLILISMKLRKPQVVYLLHHKIKPRHLLIYKLVKILNQLS